MATIDANNKDSLVEYAYESLRKLIQTATFPPGSKLSTIEISSMLNISRTPVVSALNRLVAEGLAESVPRKGIFVPKLTGKKIRDLIETRIMLEVYAARTATDNMYFFPNVLKDMEKAINDFELVGTHDYQKGATAEFNFHYGFILLSGNEELKKIYNSNCGISAAYYMYQAGNVTMDQRSAAINEHPYLLNLLKDGKKDELQKALELHLRDSLKVLNFIVDNSPNLL